jgi:hypothetical protein
LRAPYFYPNPTAADAPLSTRYGQPGLRAFANHRPFELRKAPDHLHEHTSGGCGRVNGFRETAKAGPGLREALHNMEQILERAGEAVEFPDDHHIVALQN